MHQHQIYPELRLIVIELIGPVTFEQLLKGTEELLAHPDFDQSFNGVTDYRRAEIQFSPAELKRFTDLTQTKQVALGTWCMLVSGTQQTAMVTLFKHQVEAQHPIELFSTLKAASAFIGTDLSKFLGPGE